MQLAQGKCQQSRSGCFSAWYRGHQCLRTSPPVANTVLAASRLIMAAVEIESADVVRLVMQFLKEQGLGKSLEALQDETDVSLNTVDDIETFAADIASGRWDSVLRQVASLKLLPEKLMALYEQIVRELAEVRELATARELMRVAVPLRLLKQTAGDRYHNLELLLAAPAFDARDAYAAGATKEQRRAEIAAMITEDLAVVPPGRLLALLGQAIKWQRYTGRLPAGTSFDVFRSAPPLRREEEDSACTAQVGRVAFGTETRAEAVAFSHDGAHIITGSSDGFVEVWDSETGKLDSRLAYQSRDELMMHDDAVLCLATTDDSAVLATGCKGGSIKVWELASGTCLRRFDKAHSGGVASVQFTRDGMQLLSGGSDGLARMHGLRSGQTLKEFRGHSSFVAAARFRSEDTEVITASADGTVGIWSVTTSDRTATITPPQAAATAHAPVLDAIPFTDGSRRLAVLPRGPVVYLMDDTGSTVLQEVRSPGASALAMALSPRCSFLHLLDESRQLRCFSLTGPDSGSEVSSALVQDEGDLIGVVRHPRRNRLATWGSAGICIWGKRRAESVPAFASTASSSSSLSSAAAASAAFVADFAAQDMSTELEVVTTSGDKI